MDKSLPDSVRSSFLSRFGEEPHMVWSPGRINIIGEHTDYNQGYVLPASIDRGIAMAIGKAGKGSGKWMAMDVGDEFTPNRSSSQLPNGKGWSSYLMGILSELHTKGIKPGPVDVVFSGNIPPGAGLSSSAALENAFVFGLNEVFGLGLTRMEMVHIAHAAEQNYVGVHCGIMDQYASMFGQAGKAIFLDCRSLESKYVALPANDYQWVLLDSGVKHSLADSAYNDRRRTCEGVAKRSGVTSMREVTPVMLEKIRDDIPERDFQKGLFVLQENSRVLDARTALRNGDYPTLGKLMFESHKGLKEQYGVSCEELDLLVDLARDSKGVLGARMMGGGFGGCTLNLVYKRFSSQFVKSVLPAYREHFGNPCVPYSVEITNGCHTL